MRYSLIIATLLLIFSSCSTTTYYVVRHAEKLNNTQDPPLNDAGFARAKVLSDTLRNKNINMIFTSELIRTKQTAEPTARRLEITPVIVQASETGELVNRLKRLKGKNILVVRHSNELQQIVNALSPNDTIQPVNHEYNLLFVVKKKDVLGQKKYVLSRLTYGASAAGSMK
jgi:phosphohistidine phosphatase SixA